MNRLSERRPRARGILLRSLPFWLIIPAFAYYSGGRPALYGSLIGLGLVAAYFAVSIYTASKALEKSAGFAQILVIGGFWLRLAVLGIILYALSKIKGVNLTAVILTFAIAYSIALPISLGMWLPSKRKSPKERSSGKKTDKKP